MAIGSCDNCDRQNVPIMAGEACGIEGQFCFICRGDDDADPYGELDVRVEACSGCGGDGGHEVWTHYDPRDGSPLGYWQTCRDCDGSGDELIHVQPISFNDLSFIGASHAE